MAEPVPGCAVEAGVEDTVGLELDAIELWVVMPLGMEGVWPVILGPRPAVNATGTIVT